MTKDYVGSRIEAEQVFGCWPTELFPLGNCALCGSPIYGPKKVIMGGDIYVFRTCKCHATKTIQDTMRTT